MAVQDDAGSPTAGLLPPGFTEATVDVNGVQIHYVMGGAGEPLVLLHGWPETWFCWNRVMPRLAERYTVIAPDLRGAGGSSKPPPSAGYDARTMAEDVHQLVQGLGFNRIRLVGHDIGLLVAYSYAATFPGEVERLVILDGLVVGVEPMWSQFHADTRSWVFTLHQTPDVPEMLTAGKEREYLSWFFENITYGDDALTEVELDEYVRAYSEPGAMSASFEWFRAFETDIAQFQASAQTKLKMPVLALGGETMMGNLMLPMVQSIAEDVQGGPISECGHYVAEEKPDELLARLDAFLP